MKLTTHLKKSTIALLCLVAFGFKAQNFTNIGAGTVGNSSTGYPAPYGNWYGSSTHQMFVTAAELIAAGIPGGAQIKSIGFNVLNLNSASPHQNWKMTVYATSLSDPLVSGNVSTNAVSTNTLSTYTGTVGWNQTQIAPFIWNGSDNLVIETCFYNPSSPGAVNSTFYTYNYTTAWTTTLTGTSIKCRYYYADNITSCLSQLTTSPFVPSSGTSPSTRPDMRFEWINPTPCNGAPPSNSVIAPSYVICPNTPVNLSLANGYTLGGLTYSWMSSTVSAVGPYSALTGSSAVYSAPGMTTTTYYQAVVTCTLTNNSTTTTAGTVNIAPPTISTVPYNEGFEGIVQVNSFPNCSWFASSPSVTCLTYTSSSTQGRWARTGTKFAVFYYSPPGANYMYSNGIHLDAGITYSAALWYQTEYFGYSNWTDLSILYGTAQSTTGLVSIASTNGPAVSNTYKLLSNTFQVPTSGLYYIAIRATSMSGNAPYLSWDDLSVTIPCPANTPTVTLNSNTTTICQGDQVVLTASGADTFTWNTGSNLNTLTDSPSSNTTYFVVGTNTLSMCSATLSQAITVDPIPQVYVLSNTQSVCPGSPAILSVFGDAVNYAWSNSMTGSMIMVNPSASTSYTVVGTNTYGCVNQAVQMISVLSNPTVGVSSTQPNEMCIGETQALTASGAVSYVWASSTGQTYQGTSININPVVTTVYTVTGTGANGCTSKNTINQSVAACTGLKENNLGSVNVFPNPTSGEIALSSNNNLKKLIWVTDLTGREILFTTSSLETVKIDLSNLANGVYYVKVQSSSSTSIVKVVKN